MLIAILDWGHVPQADEASKCHSVYHNIHRKALGKREDKIDDTGAGDTKNGSKSIAEVLKEGEINEIH
jgi:hypothetical protein